MAVDLSDIPTANKPSPTRAALSFDDLPKKQKVSTKGELAFDDIDTPGVVVAQYKDVRSEPVEETTARVKSFRPLAVKYGDETGEDPALLLAVVHRESKGAAGAVSSAGARGYAQFMDGTAKELGVTDPDDPDQAVRGMAVYLSRLRKQALKLGVPETEADQAALASYNYGPGNFRDTWLKARKAKKPWQRMVPKETREYMAAVLALRKGRYSNED